MRTPIPDSAIRLSYLWPCNAAHAAFTLSESFKCKITAHELKARWETDCEDFFMFREFGERPDSGFVDSEPIQFARQLLKHEIGGCIDKNLTDGVRRKKEAAA